MKYFEDNYSNIRYPIRKQNEPGLRRAQIGVLGTKAHFFTLRTHFFPQIRSFSLKFIDFYSFFIIFGVLLH